MFDDGHPRRHEKADGLLRTGAMAMALMPFMLHREPIKSLSWLSTMGASL
jgi:hypothetical protein